MAGPLTRSDVGTAYQILRDELTAALESGKPETQVRTPAFCDSEDSAESVVMDRMSGEDEGKSFAALLRIVANVAAGKPAQEAAQAWIADQAEKHAAFHADDYAEQMEDAAGPDPDDWHDAPREQGVLA